MYNGVSGLSAFQTDMDVISNNIANINTVGYKSSSVTFDEVFSQTIKGGADSGSGLSANPEQVGMGVNIGSVNVNENQGSLQSTGNASDAAIQGNGFFVLGDGQAKYYSRDGSFILDSSGNLVSSSSGMKVLGWTADSSWNINTNQPVTPASSLQIPIGQLSIAKQTSNVVFSGNISSDTTAYSVQTNIHDSLGAAHPVDVAFTRLHDYTSQATYTATTDTVGTGTFNFSVGSTPYSITLNGPPVSPATTPVQNNTLQGLADAINSSGAGVTANVVNTGTVLSPTYALQLSATTGDIAVDTSGITANGGTIPVISNVSDSKWSWTASFADGSVTVPTPPANTASFDSSGACVSGNLALSLTMTSPNGATNPVSFQIATSKLTQMAGDSTATAVSEDGLSPGELQKFSIGTDGVITGIFSNGMSRPLGRIALANFTNPQGLGQGGNNLLAESPNSGIAQIGQPAIGGMGKLMSGSVEASNVDLATEFANMIVAQRGFQANSRIITTSDQILQDLVQMKQ